MLFLLWIEQKRMKKKTDFEPPLPPLPPLPISKSLCVRYIRIFVYLHVLVFIETEEYGKDLLYYFCANGCSWLFYGLFHCLVYHSY